MDDFLQHYGIDGMRWGVRRYQNEDGSLTPAGEKRYNSLKEAKTEHIRRETISEYGSPDRDRQRAERKDAKWAHRHEASIYNQTYRKSRREMNRFVKKDLNKRLSPTNKSGYLSATYVNEYNRKLADVMNKNVKEIHSPSGKVVRWVAKRGGVGVYMALADAGYNMDQVKRGVYGSGRIAYKKDSVNTA